MINIPTRTAKKIFTVSYYSAPDARQAHVTRVVEERLLHKIFVWSYLPVSWSTPKLIASILLVALVIWLVWWPFGASTATLAAVIYLFFVSIDGLLLWWLPYSGRSFGPIPPQLLVKSVPRVGAAILSLLIVWISGSITAGVLILIGLQLFGTLVYAWGTLFEPFALAVTSHSVASPNLPVGTPPIRLLHLSDLHIERLTRRETDLLLDLIKQTRPDVIVITGDYLNLSYVDDPVARSEVRKILAKISAPYGVYATLGTPPVDPRHSTPSLFDGLEIRLLRDEVAALNFGDGRLLSLMGLDCEHNLESDGAIFEKLMPLVPANSMPVLLYHSPELMPLVQNYPVELYLCGHTHGGQIRLPFYGAIITSSITGKRYEMGLYVEQDTMLYVSRGVGLEGLSAPRMRLLCPPEITLFTLSGCEGKVGV